MVGPPDEAPARGSVGGHAIDSLDHRKPLPKPRSVAFGGRLLHPAGGLPCRRRRERNMTYRAPIDEMRFALDAVAGLPEIARLPGYEDATPDLVSAIMEEAGKLAGDVLAPLNQPGDRAGSTFENGVVRTPEGFRAAYRKFVEGGWN